jgi:two-component system, OmpR family, sensor histidine kinase VanS
MAEGDDPRLLALLSHELRGPSGVLLGYLKLLERDPGLSERQRALVLNALKAGGKLQDLLGELGDLLQFDSGTFRPERRAVPLQALIDDVMRASAAWPETPAVHVGSLPNVVLHLDRTRMTAALAAIVRAAARPSGPNATVPLHGTLDETAGVRLTIGGGDAAAEGTATVRLDESRGGLGLALPLARAVLAAHGATIHEQASTAGMPRFTVVLTTD